MRAPSGSRWSGIGAEYAHDSPPPCGVQAENQVRQGVLDRHGLGLEPIQCLPFGSARKHQRRVQLGGRRRRQVGVHPVAHHERPALALDAVQGGEHQLRLGLSDYLRLSVARHLDRCQDRSGAGPQAVGLGVGGVARGGEEVGAAADRERGVAEVVVDEVLRAAHHDDLGARGQVGSVQHAQAGVGHVAAQRLRAHHERGAAGARLGQEVLERAADGHHVAEGRADADPPEPRHVVLGRAARVVRGVDHRLSGLAQRRRSPPPRVVWARRRSTRSRRDRG